VDGAGYFDGAVDMDSTLDVAGAVALASDVTLATDATGGNALAKNEFIGLPRITIYSLSTLSDASETVVTDIGDSETPATDWTAVDGDTVMSNDGTYYRQGSASLKMAVADTADEDDGCTNTLDSSDQDWTDDASVGMWFYCDRTLTAGDLEFVIHDSVAGDTSHNFPAYSTADTWEWIEIDVSGTANASKDVIENVDIVLSAAGATVASGGAFNVYMDFIVKWDDAEEDSLGHEIVQDGVLGLVIHDTSSGAAAGANATLYTDYFVHYQSGNDAIVCMTDQSDADKLGLALIAY